VAFPYKVPNIEVVPLHKYPMVLICAPQHALAGKKSVRMKELAGQRFVGFEPDMPTRRAIDKVLREHHVPVQYAMEFDNIETVKRAVEIDAGIAVVPHNTVLQEVANGSLAAVKLESTSLDRPWAVLCKSNKILSPAMKQFITVLKGEP
jgi:LysR family transcriptional regulator, transcriptional activator of the cysJI operon